MGSKINIFNEYINLYEQYKKKYEKIVLLYEFGNFYQIYGVDNDKEKLGNVYEIHKDLEMVVSRSNKKIKENSRANPLQIGFPSVSLETYISRFISFNYTVVIYKEFDELTNTNVKKITRKLDKIISCGTYVNEDIIQESVIIGILFIEEIKENFLISLFFLDSVSGKTYGYSIGDIKEESIKKTIKIIHSEINPKELIVCNKSISLDSNQIVKIFELENIKINYFENKDLDIYGKISYQNEFIKKIYPRVFTKNSLKSSTLLSPIEYINMENYPSLVISFIILLDYVYKFDKTILDNVEIPKINKISNNLTLNHKTIQQLNIINSNKDKSVFDVLNLTNTIGGKRLLKQRLVNPITSEKQLNLRYLEIEESSKTIELYDKYLEEIIDLDRYHQKIFSGRLNPFDFLKLNNSYSNILKILKNENYPCKKHTTPKIIEEFEDFVNFYNKTLNLELLEEQYNLLNSKEQKKIQNVGTIFNSGIYSDIDEMLKDLEVSQYMLKNLAEELSKLAGGEVKVRNTDSEGYFLETTLKRWKELEKYNSKYKFEIKVQKNYVKIYNEVIKNYSSILLSFSESMKNLNVEKFNNFLSEIKLKYQKTLKNISTYISNVDLNYCIVKVSKLYNYCKPEICNKNDKSYLDILELRHPILERIDNGEEYISNNVEMGLNKLGIILCAINGSGKSILLKSVGISIILAQAGFYVPASSFKFYPYKFVLAKINNYDDIYRGKSTFACEMDDLRAMLKYSGPNTLILCDELVSSSEVESGISILASSILSLEKTKSNFFFTTHYHHLRKIINLENVKFYHLDIDYSNNKIIYKRKIKEGHGKELYGIEVCEKLNVGDLDFIRNAYSIRDKLKINYEENFSPKILNPKPSKYNKDLYVNECSNCGSKENLHTHHIKPQKDSDENGMIEGYHKNSLFNLKILCEDCHTNIHNKK